MTTRTIICHICNDSFKYESRFEKHLSLEHEIQDMRLLFRQLNNCTNLCLCGCGEETKWWGWEKGYSKYIKGHNTRTDCVFSKPEVMQKAVNSRLMGYATGKYTTWNKGLTKESSEKVAMMSKKISTSLFKRSKTHVSWQLGKTKETDDRIRRAVNTKITKFASGELKSWNDGLTKESSEKIREIGKKISFAYSSRREIGKRLSVDEVEKRFNEMGFVIIDKNEYATRKQSKLSVICNVCGEIQKRTLSSIESSRKCFGCYPKESLGQIELYEFVKSIIPTALISNREIIKPLEVDVYVPSHSFAIEYNGLFWHSDKFLDKNYHVRKLDRCKKVGLNLLNVFEDEWKNKRNIVESMILKKLKRFDLVVDANDCIMKRVMKDEQKSFFIENHIDGDAISDESFGFYYNNMLVSCIAFKNIASSEKRFVHCEKLRTNVTNSIRIFLENIKNCVSTTIDERYENFDELISLGFAIKKQKLASWYTDAYERTNKRNSSTIARIFCCKKLTLIREQQ